MNYDVNDSYFLFNHQNLKTLDLNTVTDDSVVVFPRNIYTKELLAQPDHVCDPNRDTDFFYLYGREVIEHPHHFSKFDNTKCYFGWCYGAQSGRNYQCVKK